MKMFNKTCTKVVDDDDDDGGKVDDKMNRDANLINYYKKKIIGDIVREFFSFSSLRFALIITIIIILIIEMCGKS